MYPDAICNDEHAKPPINDGIDLLLYPPIPPPNNAANEKFKCDEPVGLSILFIFIK